MHNQSIEQIAVHLVSNRWQMMLKCGKNKKVVHKVMAKYVTECPHHILTSSVINYWTDAQHEEIDYFITDF